MWNLQNRSWKFCRYCSNMRPSTARTVNDVLNEQKREVQYTSTLKLMQIMFEKGLLLRDDSQMKHVHSATVGRTKTKKCFIGPLY